MAPIEFQSPQLYAEHVPESHRTVNPDHTVTEVELPGRIVVGVVLNGVKQPLQELKAGNLLQALAEKKESEPHHSEGHWSQ